MTSDFRDPVLVLSNGKVSLPKIEWLFARFAKSTSDFVVSVHISRSAYKEVGDLLGADAQWDIAEVSSLFEGAGLFSASSLKASLKGNTATVVSDSTQQGAAGGTTLIQEIQPSHSSEQRHQVAPFYGMKPLEPPEINSVFYPSILKFIKTKTSWTSDLTNKLTEDSSIPASSKVAIPTDNEANREITATEISLAMAAALQRNKQGIWNGLKTAATFLVGREKRRLLRSGGPFAPKNQSGQPSTGWVPPYDNVYGGFFVGFEDGLELGGVRLNGPAANMYLRFTIDPVEASKQDLEDGFALP